MDFTILGMTILFSDEHSSNTRSLSFVSDDGNSMVERFLQFWNARLPMIFRLLGRVTVDRLAQSLNTSAPNSLNGPSKVTSVSRKH